MHLETAVLWVARECGTFLQNPAMKVLGLPEDPDLLSVPSPHADHSLLCQLFGTRTDMSEWLTLDVALMSWYLVHVSGCVGSMHTSMADL